jgi:hypothetical protein
VAELQKQKNERLHMALLASRQEELGIVPPPSAAVAVSGSSGSTSPTAAAPVVPFQPRVNPVSERLAREKEAKERALAVSTPAGAVAEAQRVQDALDDPATATPAAQRAVRLADTGRTDVVLGRLRLAEAQAQVVAQTHTFRPQVNSVSEKLVASSPLFVGLDGSKRPSDFLVRQERMQAVAAAAALERQRLEALHSEYTFKPNIGNADAVLAASKWRGAVAAAAAAGLPPQEAAQFLPSESAEEQSPSARAERLSALESRELSVLKSKLQQVHDAAAGLTFRPEISAVSRRLAEQRAQAVAAAGGAEADSHARKVAAQLIAEKQDANFRAAHPFKPALSAASSEMVARGLVSARYDSQGLAGLTDALKQSAAEREAKRAALARVAEMKELRECTFSPSKAVEAELGPKRKLGAVPRAVKDASARPVLVRGMNRFLELKALHKKQQDEADERRRKVFLSDIYDYEVAPDGTPLIGLNAMTTTATTPTAATGAGTPKAASTTGAGVYAHVHAGAPDGYTKPQPFALSHSTRAPQRAQQAARVQREAREEETRECTFRPATTQAQHRQLIQQILKEDGPTPL